MHEILCEALSYDDAVKIWRGFGVDPRNMAADELKRRHRSLAQRFHPDAGGNLIDMQMLNAAYDVLKNPRPTSSSSGGYGQSSYRRQEEPEEYPIWAMAGHSGGMRDSGRIHKNDYRDVNFIKKRMWELSGHSREEWEVSGFDGNFMRGSFTAYASPKIFNDMAEAMITWQTKGANSYRCRAVIANRRRSHERFIIWADGRSYANNPVPAPASDSFNDNPSNDPRFTERLRDLLDKMEENGGPLPDQPDLGLSGARGYRAGIETGDRVLHPRYGMGTVINPQIRRGYARVYFGVDDHGNKTVRTDSLTKDRFRR